MCMDSHIRTSRVSTMPMPTGVSSDIYRAAATVCVYIYTYIYLSISIYSDIYRATATAHSVVKNFLFWRGRTWTMPMPTGVCSDSDIAFFSYSCATTKTPAFAPIHAYLCRKEPPCGAGVWGTMTAYKYSISTPMRACEMRAGVRGVRTCETCARLGHI